MTAFNLSEFPNVCRLCVKPEADALVQPLDGSFTNCKQSIAEFLDEVTFRVPEDKAKHLPKMICLSCIEELERFAVYRRKLQLTLRLMEALIDLKESNPTTLTSLFTNSKHELDVLFMDLSLCNKEEVQVEDLLDEFPKYEFASCTKDELKLRDGVDGALIKEESLDVPEDKDVPTVDVQEDKDISTVEDDDPDYEYNSNDNSEHDSEPDMKPEVIYLQPAEEDDSTRKPRRRKRTDSQGAEKKRGKRKGSNETRRRGRPRIYPDGSFLAEPWSCDKCKFQTKYRIAVERHKAVHVKRENRTYPCSECGQVFKTYDEMRSHSLSHLENQVVCEVCGIALRNSYSLKAHMERHEDTRKYTCEYCDYASNTKLSLKAHMSIHTKNNWNKRCEVCGVIFRTSSRLKRHMEGHTNERKYACDQCPARFNTTNALRNHHTRVHMAIRHACDHCDKSYDQKIALRDHIERIHHIQCNFICDICVMTYDSQDRLEAHMLRHANPKPMECRICLTLHLNQEDFDKHMCITYRDDYQCCNKDLRNHLQYNKHMLVKHGIKINARVKPIPGMLLGQLRGARKRLEQCRKCDIAFPSRALKLQHLAVCNQSEQEGTVAEEGNVDVTTNY